MRNKKIRNSKDEKVRGSIKYLYLFGVIVIVILCCYLFFSDHKIFNILGVIIFSTYMIGGSIISFYLELPIWGSTASFFDIDRKSFGMFNMFLNLFIIGLCIYLWVYAISNDFSLK